MLRKLFLLLGFAVATTLAANAMAAERVQVPAGIFGGTTYQYSFALGEVMKTANPKYEFVPIETTGIPGCIIKGAEKPASSVFALGGMAFRDALKGVKPYPKKMENLKLIGFVTQNIQTLFSYDPSIRELKDMSGKRFITTGVMSTNGKMFWNILKRGIPGSEKMNPSYANWSAIQSAILDGTADVGALGVTSNENGKWTPVSIYAEMNASKGAPHFISVDRKLIEEAAKAEGLSYVPVVMPKGAIAENVPDTDIQCWEDRLGIGAFAEISDELAYTIAKILCEQQEDIAKYTPVGKSMSKNVTVPAAAFTDDMIHPGALKYYKEKGLR